MPEKNVIHIEDKDLLDRYYRDPNNEVLGDLLTRYSMLLFGVCMKYLHNEEDAKDAVQQIFLKVISELPKYRVEYFKSWIYMIARNHCLMQLRGKNMHAVEIDERLSLPKEDNELNEKLLQKELSLNELEEALKKLNKEQYECVTLFYLQKRSYAAITAVTGFTLLQVKSFIQNGKRNLKQLLMATDKTNRETNPNKKS